MAIDRKRAVIKRIQESIPGTGGIISEIADKAGIAWHTAKKYIEGNEKLKSLYDEETEKILDLAESKLIAKIQQGDMWAIQLYLQKKGKARGYGEQPALINAGNLQINALLKNLTTEELLEVTKALS